MVNCRQAVSADDKSFDVVKRGLMMASPRWESHIAFFPSKWHEYCGVFGKSGEKCCDISD